MLINARGKVVSDCTHSLAPQTISLVQGIGQANTGSQSERLKKCASGRELTPKSPALLAKPKPAGPADLKPADWAKGSLALAKSKVYVSPISDDNDPSVKISPRPDAAYEKMPKKRRRFRYC
jgi:hypothetical protein